MAKFAGNLTVLDPRVPFSVRKNGAVFDLGRDIVMNLVYEVGIDNVKDSLTGVTSNALGGDVDAAAFLPGYLTPTAWRLKKSGGGQWARIPRGNWVTHASDATTVSFWVRNVAGAPATMGPSYQPFVVTSNSVTANPELQTFTKFSVYTIAYGSTGEELTFGWNNGGSTQWYLSTRNTEKYENNAFSIGVGGYGKGGANPFVFQMQPVILKYNEWNHITICTSKGNSNLSSGVQDTISGYFGYSSVYVNGDFVGTYLGTVDPGHLYRPYGSSPVEKYGMPDYQNIAPTNGDRLWFPYDASLCNRYYYQFCSWRRILSATEIKALYEGTLNGVYIENQTNYSAPPRKSKITPSRVTKNVNVGFGDSSGVLNVKPFDDKRVIIGETKAYLGSNYLIEQVSKTAIPVNGEKVTGIQGELPAVTVNREIDALPEDIPYLPFSEKVDKEMLRLTDGSEAKAFIRIPVPTIGSDTNLMIAGRTDSNMGKRVSDLPSLNVGSMFMSSALKDDTSLYNNYFFTNRRPTGVAGTGFLYYSPTYRTWIEKRSYGDWTKLPLPDQIQNEYTGSCNSITYDTAKSFSPNAAQVTDFYLGQTTGSSKFPWNLANVRYNPTGSQGLAGWYWSGSFSSVPIVTGVNEIMAQFTSSPQLGYFLPFKEHLESSGYPTIGSPTVTFGAPFAPRYHAQDHETIKLSSYIDRPFRLKKVILRVPVRMVRKNEILDDTPFGGVSGEEYTRNIPARKDLDNYVFFLYRQRRQGGEIIDSLSDFSSSVRFLIASGSVCVYNSPSFGRAYHDGFSGSFGHDTPIVREVAPNYFVTSSLKSLYKKCKDNLFDPISSGTLTNWNEPLHGPAYSIDANLGDFTKNTRHTFSKDQVLEIEMYPAVVLGGNANGSLTYVTSTTGMYTSSFFFCEERNSAGVYYAGRNRLFNRYPYTGTFSFPDKKDISPPITTTVQNIWLGGTRQPVVSNQASEGTFAGFSGKDSFLDVGPYFSHIRGGITETSRSVYFTGPRVSGTYVDPNFDVEIGRTGFSVSTFEKNPFSTPFQIVTDGRTVPNSYSPDAANKLAAVFQRTNLIRFDVNQADEGMSYSPMYLSASHTSIGTLSGSNMAHLVSSLTVGYSVPSPNTNRQVIRDYILLPTDELILGLDAGVSPAPDVAPITGEPVPDKLV